MAKPPSWMAPRPGNTNYDVTIIRDLNTQNTCSLKGWGVKFYHIHSTFLPIFFLVKIWIKYVEFYLCSNDNICGIKARAHACGVWKFFTTWCWQLYDPSCDHSLRKTSIFHGHGFLLYRAADLESEISKPLAGIHADVSQYARITSKLPNCTWTCHALGACILKLLSVERTSTCCFCSSVNLYSVILHIHYHNKIHLCNTSVCACFVFRTTFCETVSLWNILYIAK